MKPGRKLLYLLLACILIPILGTVINSDLLLLILVIIWICIIPTGIVLWIDWYRNEVNKKSDSKIFKGIIKISIAGLGFMSIFLGVMIIGWIIYNIFIEKQKNYIKSVEILSHIGTGSMFIGFGFYLLKISIANKGSNIPEYGSQFNPTNIPDLNISSGAVEVDIGYLAEDDHMNAFIDIFEKFVYDNKDNVSIYKSIKAKVENSSSSWIQDIGKTDGVKYLLANSREIGKELYSLGSDEVRLVFSDLFVEKELVIIFDNPYFKWVS